jgi:hypothetical protein
MARASSDVIVACLDDIRAGHRTLEQCVRDHPEAAAELRELASVAMAVQPDESLHLDESSRLRGRAQLLAAISHNGHHAAEDRRMFGVRGVVGLPPRWLGAIGAAVGALAAGGAVVYAAQGAPPDSPLYPVQQAVQVVAAVVAPATPTPSPTPSPTAVPVLSVPPPAQQAIVRPTVVPPTPVPTPPSVPSNRASLAPAASGRGEGDRGDNGRGQQDNARDQKGGNGRGNGGGDDRRAEDRRVATVATPRASATPTPSTSGDRHSGDDGEDDQAGGDRRGGASRR